MTVGYFISAASVELGILQNRGIGLDRAYTSVLFSRPLQRGLSGTRAQSRGYDSKNIVLSISILHRSTAGGCE